MSAIFLNKESLPRIASIFMAWTSTYSSPLTYGQAAHLLRRASFGPTPEQLKAFSGKSASDVLTVLMKATPAEHPTDQAGKTFHDLSFGAPETEAVKQNTLDEQRAVLVKQWWLGLMLDPARGFFEKLSLFWQNHFVIATTDVNDVRYVYTYLTTIRQNALGSFRNFVVEVTKDPAMLRYLNGNENLVGRPNENYARELMELFALGRDNYTENDIKEAARALTGWQVLNYRSTRTAEIGSQFNLQRHDKEGKIFSDNFQKFEIKGRDNGTAGDDELQELVDMLLRHPESARFIVRKFYRWYFTAEISEEVEKNFIEPMAIEFRKTFEIAPLLKKMLTSDHFFDPAIQAAQIRSPLDFVMGTLLLVGNEVPNATSDRRIYDLLTNTIFRRPRVLEMDVLDQPTVFGWRPYYDAGYYKIWINGTTLGLRGEFAEQAVKGANAQGLRPDVVRLVNTLSVPGDALELVKGLWALLMAVPPSQEQLDNVIDEVLLEGIPRYEWTEIWNTYRANQNDNTAINNVRFRVESVLAYLMRMAEYQIG
jgi:uncharacterized protein (DUF1800 family)